MVGPLSIHCPICSVDPRAPCLRYRRGEPTVTRTPHPARALAAEAQAGATPCHTCGGDPTCEFDGAAASCGVAPWGAYCDRCADEGTDTIHEKTPAEAVDVWNWEQFALKREAREEAERAADLEAAGPDIQNDARRDERSER